MISYDNLLVLSSVLWVDGNLSVDVSGYKCINFSSLQPKGRFYYNSQWVYSVTQSTLHLKFCVTPRKIYVQIFPVSSIYTILADFP